MRETRRVASFHHILVSGLGGDSASVLTFLTKPENWEVLDGTGGL